MLAKRDGKYSSAANSLGYRWLEAETVKAAGLEDQIDPSFHRHLVDEAYAAISEYGDAEQFIYGSDDGSDIPPWCDTKVDCDTCKEYANCKGNPHVPF